jgi:hypothetical protein
MKREAYYLPSLLFFTFLIFTSLPSKDISSACEFDFLFLVKICGQPLRLSLQNLFRNLFKKEVFI